MSGARSIAKAGLPAVKVELENEVVDSGPPADVHPPPQMTTGWATLQPVETQATLGDPAHPALPHAPGRRHVTLVAPTMTVSRKDTLPDTTCVTIKHSKVSSRHCVITRAMKEGDPIADDVLATCRDLDSTSGTFVLRRDGPDAGFVKLIAGDEIGLRCFDLVKMGSQTDHGYVTQ